LSFRSRQTGHSGCRLRFVFGYACRAQGLYSSTIIVLMAKKRPPCGPMATAFEQQRSLGGTLARARRRLTR
jgi:hypothetical protein